MKISIVSAAYNSAKTIRGTIDSVLSQDYPNKEYIVVDGGSKDETIAILKSYGDKIRFISEPDKGIYDALNKGVRMATGDVIGIIGSDDFYPTNNVLSKVAANFLEHKTDSLYGDKQYVNSDDLHTVVRFWKSGDYEREKFLMGWMPPHLSFYLKKEIYEKFGLYRTDFTCSADYELMLRMLYKHKISTHYLPEVLTTMRNGGTSNASWKHRLRANLEDRRAWEVNDLKPHWFTLWLKPISKIQQLFHKKQL